MIGYDQPVRRSPTRRLLSVVPLLLLAGAFSPGPAIGADRVAVQPNGSHRITVTFLAPDGCHRVASTQIRPVMQSGYAPVDVRIRRSPGPCTMALRPLSVTATLPTHHALRGALVTFRDDGGRVMEQRRLTFGQ